MNSEHEAVRGTVRLSLMKLYHNFRSNRFDAFEFQPLIRTMKCLTRQYKLRSLIQSENRSPFFQ